MSFSPRLTSNNMYQNKWWYSTENIYYPNYQLPNCTCYCYGRYAEIQGQFYDLPNANAGEWFRLAKTFSKGQIPKLGSIACWYSPTSSYYGHVAVVEEITENGDIITSNSGYYRPINSYPPSTKNYFWTETCYKSNGYRSTWEAQRGYRLAGFIYLNGEPIDPTPTEWIKGNRYLTIEEMQNNAFIIYSLLFKNWSLEAISGMLGNMQRESTINPGIWQNLVVNINNGFGLVQWTPSTNYTTWADENNFEHDDGNAQIKWIDEETLNSGQWIPTTQYPLSFNQFKVSSDTPENLASAFMFNFERPGIGSEDERRSNARYWYNYLINLDPDNPNPDINDKKRKMPIWMYLKYRW